MELKFRPCNKEQELLKCFEYDVNAFSDVPDFDWSLKGLKRELKEGWRAFAAVVEKKIVAVLLVKIEGDALVTKNTSLVITHQGLGISHKIKEFYEEEARKLNLKKIIHLCREDQFRMISLNEGHGYKKMAIHQGKNGPFLEWEKVLS